MALTPGLYVPQGQVGTGAAYVHQIKDKSGQLEAIAKIAEKQRVEQEKQMAKLKGFDYGKVTDPVMKEHISKKYKEGLETFAAITAAGGDIASISTPEGIAFSTWQNQIKDEADTAALAESKISDFRKTVQLSPKEYDLMLAGSVTSAYENAKTPDEKLAATMDADPILLKTFDFTKWIKEEIEPAKTDKEITELGEDITKYDNVYNEKLNQVPEILASKQGINLAKKSWQIYHDRGEAGFQQESFDDYVKDAIEAQRKIREFKTESPAAKPGDTNIFMPGATPVSGTVTPSEVSQTAAINFDLGKAAANGSGTGEQLFWTANPQRPTVPYLVLKGKGGNPAEYGLSEEQGAIPDPSDEQNGILVPADQLWKLASPQVSAIDLQIGDDTDEARKFKSKAFKDETGKNFTGQPKQIYEDQLGNTWMDMTDAKASGVGHILLKAGGISQTYKDQYGKLKTNPLVNIANSNMEALEAALGINYDEFIRTYQKVNFK
jgi:hypothetical protein